MIKLEIFVDEERAKQILDSGEEVTIMLKSHFDSLLKRLEVIHGRAEDGRAVAERIEDLIKELREGNVNSPE